MGYVRQVAESGRYLLTSKLAALGLSYLGAMGITDLVQPLMEDLAERISELVTLSVVESGSLIRVAKAQGGRHGLLYNPKEGPEVHLASTAIGILWLSRLSDEEALSLLVKQGIRTGEFGPDAPKTMAEALDAVARTRDEDYAFVKNSYEPGIAAVAVPVLHSTNKSFMGTLSVSGPSIRFTKTRIAELVQLLTVTSGEISLAARNSSFFAHC